MSDYQCSIVSCVDYSQRAVERAFDELLPPVGGLDWVTEGMRVVIKPNLVSAMKPEQAATTHPALLKELCRRLTDRGATVLIGDSPGGFFTVAALNAVYAATGLSSLERAGVSLNRSVAYHTVQIDGAAMKQLTYTDYLDEADAIIDFCKLKSHGMVGMSGAVKNMYGVIPGLMKPETHYIYPDVTDFANMLIDINQHFPIRMAFVDAVQGMEGNGPTAGDPRFIGALIAAKTTYHADIIGARLIGLDPSGVPTLVEASKRGLAPLDYREVKLCGDVAAMSVPDFKYVPRKSIRFLNGTKFVFVQRFVSDCFTHKPRPVNKLCIGCGKCQRLCPAHAITMQHGRPHIDRSKCIRCFCCQEFCPRAAMIVSRPLVARLLQKQR